MFKVLKLKENLPDLDYNVAFGFFDSFHNGHIDLINYLKENTDSKKLKAITLFVDEDNLIKKDNVFTLEERIFIARNLDFDAIIIINFDLQVKKTFSDDFIKKLNETIKINRIFVGEGFKFGVDRKQLNKESDLFKVFNINNFEEKNSSTLIINLLKNSNLPKANEYFSNFIRYYFIKSKQVVGFGIGKKQLYPTINLKINKKILISEGVYSTYTQIDNIVYESVSFFGVNKVPGIENFKPSVETYIINKNFNGLKNKDTDIIIFFVKKQRDNIIFQDISKLKNQIEEDIKNRIKNTL